MKHREPTCKKFYMLHFYYTESTRMSMKCHNAFHLDHSDGKKKVSIVLLYYNIFNSISSSSSSSSSSTFLSNCVSMVMSFRRNRVMMNCS